MNMLHFTKVIFKGAICLVILLLSTAAVLAQHKVISAPGNIYSFCSPGTLVDVSASNNKPKLNEPVVLTFHAYAPQNHDLKKMMCGFVIKDGIELIE